ncbi:MAG: BTAD domain-containing putative transcriptional regulator [Proteocatella sp.]
MYKIVVTMLDFPSVKLNDKEIIFPYKKLEALFYYLCVKKKISRDEATYLFWSDHNESNAKKNLRDALYNLKKLFGFDIILNVKNKYITLNNDYDISIDMDDFLKNKDISIYKTDFLENFHVKNCYEFDAWCEETRDFVKIEYNNLLYLKIQETLESKNAEQLEYYSKILIKSHPYDETLYRNLMSAFSSLNRCNNAITLYSQLCETLNRDLKVSPEKETQDLFEKILLKIESDNAKSRSLYYSSFENNRKLELENRKFPTKSQALIKNKILKLNSKEKTIAEIIAIFPQKCSFEEIKIFSKISEPEIFSYLENLISKLIIKEFPVGYKVYYSFTSDKIKQIVYEAQSLSKRRYLHNLIGEYYESQYILSPNLQICSKLIYHYEKSYALSKTYNYKLDYLNEICKAQHEIYPLIYFEASSYSDEQLSVDEAYIFKLFDEIKTVSLEFESEFEVKKIYMKYYYIIGRYYISQGMYEQGFQYVNNCISFAKEIEAYDYLFSSYIQLIFQCIQTDDIINMKTYLNKAFNYLKFSYNKENLAIMMRLKGLYLYKISALKDAEKLLTKSITLLKTDSITKPYYNIAIAASLNYLGKIAISNNNYELALKYFEEGITLCKNDYSLNALGMFYANSAKLFYDTKNYEKAKDYISSSIDCFEKNNFLWGRGFAEAYAAIIELSLSNESSAFAHYHISKKINQSLSHPEALELLKKLDTIF